MFPVERKHRQTEQIGKQLAMCNRAEQLRILRERCVQTLYAREKGRQNFPAQRHNGVTHWGVVN